MNIKLDDKYTDQDYLTFKKSMTGIKLEEKKALQSTLF